MLIIKLRDGEVLQHTRYYPYGEAIDVFDASVLANTATTADRAQPYLYGGKELERMHGLGEYDYGARRLQSHLPLWTTQDPCLEKYYSTSPYAYCAANPIRFTDPTGCQFTWYSVQYVERFLQEVQRRKDQAQSNKQQLLSQLCGGNLSVEQMSDIAQQINNETAKIEEFKAIVEEIDILTNSSQVYSISIDPRITGPNGENVGIWGVTDINIENEIVEISLSSSDVGLLGHELKHAFQFEIGEFSFGRYKNGVPFYDWTDEIAAYKRQCVINNETFREEDYPLYIYQDLQDSYKSCYLFVNEQLKNCPKNSIERALMNLCKRTKSFFRWDGKNFNGLKY